MPFKWSGKKAGKNTCNKPNLTSQSMSQCKRQYIQCWLIKTEDLSMCCMHCRCKPRVTQNLHNCVQSNTIQFLCWWYCANMISWHTQTFLRQKTLSLNIGSFIKYCVMLQRQYAVSKIKYWLLYFQTNKLLSWQSFSLQLKTRAVNNNKTNCN